MKAIMIAVIAVVMVGCCTYQRIGFGDVHVGERPSVEKVKSLNGFYFGEPKYGDKTYQELWLNCNNRNVMCTLNNNGEIVAIDVWQDNFQSAKALFEKLRDEKKSKKADVQIQLVIPDTTKDNDMKGECLIRIVKKDLAKELTCEYVEASEKLKKRIEAMK